MRTGALVALVAVASISCTFSHDGLEVTADAGVGPSGQVAPDPTRFQGGPEDAARPASLPSDAAPIADAGAPAPMSPPPAPPPDAAPPPPRPDAATTPPPPPAPGLPRVLRIHDLKVGRLTAAVVHAHQLDATSGSAGLVLPPEPDALLKLELGTQDLEVTELTVDVLFAHDIKAGWVGIGTTHAKLKKKEREGGD